MIYSIYVLGREYSHLALKLFESFKDPNNLDQGALNKAFENCDCPPGKSSVGCQGFVGFQHEMGLGVAIDLKRALAMYQLALKRRRAPEQLFAVSHCCKKLGDTAEDRKLQFEHCREAAGNPKAELRLGELYYFGKLDSGKNLEKAFLWYRKAAKHGNAHAQYSVAVMSEQVGTPFYNIEKAVKWYARALKQEYEKALPELERLATKKTT